MIEPDRLVPKPLYLVCYKMAKWVFRWEAEDEGSRVGIVETVLQELQPVEMKTLEIGLGAICVSLWQRIYLYFVHGLRVVD